MTARTYTPQEFRSKGRFDVWLLTGFLGSGKTTLLRHLSEQFPPGELALIINEFADVGIDQQIIQSVADDVVVLEGGCACCVVKDDLVEGLHRLLRRVHAGQFHRLRAVLIETSGIADPNPIIHALRADQRLREQLNPAVVLTVVDATRAMDQLERFAEVAPQIAAADCLLLSKLDLALPQTVGVLEQRLTELNPLAIQHHLDHGRITDFAKGFLRSFPRANGVEATLRGMNDATCHSPDIVAQMIEVPGTVDWLVFCDWLQAVCLACGRDLMRAKGIIHAKGETCRRLINAVNFSIYPPELLPPESGATEPVCRLILIGRNLDGLRLRRTLDAALR